MIGVIIISGAYSKEGADSSDKRAVQKTAQDSGERLVNAGLIDFIKRQKLVNFTSTTIGNAFDSYRYL